MNHYTTFLMTLTVAGLRQYKSAVRTLTAIGMDYDRASDMVIEHMVAARERRTSYQRGRDTADYISKVSAAR